MWDRLNKLMLLSAVIGALALPATAAADEAPGAGTTATGGSAPLSPSDEKIVGADAQPLEAGLYEVPVPGPNLITHGPDSERAMSLQDQRAGTGSNIGFDPGNVERNPVCSGDYFQHILYARTPSTPNRFDEVKPQIQAAVRRMDAVLNADALESGGVTADYKVLCDGSGNVRVDQFTAPSSSFDDIVTAAKANGFDYGNADYTIFFDGGGDACGVGSFINDEHLAANNASNTGGGYGVAYKECWFNETPMHENGHAEGAVQYGAPNSTGSGGHCNDGYDVMCYSPDGGNLRQGGLVVRCADRVHFDCNGDDYFDPSPAPGSYLDNHWNLGSPLNRFMTFGPAPAGGSGSGSGGGTGGAGGVIGGVVGTLSGQVTSLVGRHASASAAPANGWQFIKLRVRRGANFLTVNLHGQRAADLDLYVRPRAKPSDSLHRCMSISNDSSEHCRIANPKAGTWYAGVYSSKGSGGSTFNVEVSQTR